MSTRSAGRTSSCSTAPRSGCIPIARSPSSCRPSAKWSTTLRWERTGNGWRCVDGPVAKLEENADKDDYAACMLGLRDYVDKNGFKGVVLGLVRRHRLRAGGGAGGRCARSRARALRDAALSLHLAGVARRCRRRRRGARRRTTTWCRSRARSLGLERSLAPLLRGHAARRHRGEPAGARARHHPDGDLQQARADGGDDRQQVGNVGRLCHALRRHERRLQPDQGPLQDRGLPAGAAAQWLDARRRARSGTGR